MALNGGCYLDLEQLDNISSEWELNPETMRVRVKAPKTKEEAYPDYDTEEAETAHQVSRLCNREIPVGSRSHSENSGKKQESEEQGFARGEGEEESDSEEEASKITRPGEDNKRDNDDSAIDTNSAGGYDSPDDGFIESEFEQKGSANIGATKKSRANRSRKSHRGRVAKSDGKAAKRNRNRRIRALNLRKNNKSVITSFDYRARRDLLSDQSLACEKKAKE